MQDIYASRNTRSVTYTITYRIAAFEHRCFGWDIDNLQDEHRTSVKGNVYSGTVHTTHKVIHHASFSRPAAWVNQPLFWFTEMLWRFVSFLRRLLFWFYPALIVVTVLLLFFGGSEIAAKFAMFLLAWPAFLGLSVILALIGGAWKKAFCLEEKTEALLNEHGYTNIRQ